jgi:hypothetical protein
MPPNLISGDTIIDFRLVGNDLILEVQSCCDAAPRTYTVDVTALAALTAPEPLRREGQAQPTRTQ